MPKHKLRIHYPRHHPPVRGCVFTAYGVAAAGVTGITGKLTNSEGTVINGTRLKDGPQWAISFHPATAGDHTLVGDYTFTVNGSGGSSDTITFSCEATNYNIGIIYPPSMSAVDNSFVATGTSSDTCPVSGQMSNSTVTFTGNTLQGPPNYSIQFIGIPAGLYTLTVSNTEGSGANSQNLMVVGQMIQQPS
jgi:hypothetical protein